MSNKELPDVAEAREKVLRDALKPFADAADLYDPDEGDGSMADWADDGITIGHLRAARVALGPNDVEGDAGMDAVQEQHRK